MWCIFHVDVDVDVLNLESALSHVVEESGVAFDLMNHAVLFCFLFYSATRWRHADFEIMFRFGAFEYWGAEERRLLLSILGCSHIFLKFS